MFSKFFGNTTVSTPNDNISDNINNIIINNDIIKNLIADNILLKEEVKQLKINNDNYIKTINENKEQIIMLTAVVNDHTNQCIKYENQLKELEIINQNLSVNINDMKTNYENVIKQNENYNNIINTLTNKISEIQSDYNSVKQPIDLIEKRINDMVLINDFNNTINQYVLKSEYLTYQTNINNIIEEHKVNTNNFISKYEPIINEVSTYIINHKDDSLNYMNKSEYNELINIINDKLNDYIETTLFNKIIDNINNKINQIDDILHSIPATISTLSQLKNQYNDHAHNILSIHSKINCIGEIERKIISLTERFNEFCNNNITICSETENNIQILSEKIQNIENEIYNNDNSEKSETNENIELNDTINDNIINDYKTCDNKNQELYDEIEKFLNETIEHYEQGNDKYIDNEIVNVDNRDNINNDSDDDMKQDDNIINKEDNNSSEQNSNNNSEESSLLSSIDNELNINTELYNHYSSMKSADLKYILKTNNIDIKNMRKKDLVLKCIEISDN